jgi:hypothetical protein
MAGAAVNVIVAAANANAYFFIVLIPIPSVLPTETSVSLFMTPQRKLNVQGKCVICGQSPDNAGRTERRLSIQPLVDVVYEPI